MKKTLYTLFLLLFTFFARNSSAQVIDGRPQDSAIVTFTTSSMAGSNPDTSATPLWHIGHSYKAFFGTDSTGETTIMTDTLNPYPANANNWFAIKIPLQLNTIVDFWHKFQTDSGHAGGTVEYSFDSGATWQNVKGACNVDGPTIMQGIHTNNFYSASDTLPNGTPTFQGIQDSTIFSRLQFFEGIPLRTSSGGSGCDFEMYRSVYIRFRFISDSVNDSLAGWMIDSIKIEYDDYGSSVARISRPELKVYPNPAYDGIFHFPALYDEAQYQVDVYNMMGSRVLSLPYTTDLSLEHYPAGMYYYKVSSPGTDYYSGKLLKE